MSTTKIQPVLPAGVASHSVTDLRVHHIGVAVPVLDEAIRTYRDLFGYALQSGPYDDPIQRVAVCFLEKAAGGECLIELIAPLAGDSPIKGVLAKGGGAYHICFETPDIEKSLADMVEKRCIVVSRPVPAVAFGQRRIAWLYTAGRQLVELVEAENGSSSEFLPIGECQ